MHRESTLEGCGLSRPVIGEKALLDASPVAMKSDSLMPPALEICTDLFRGRKRDKIEICAVFGRRRIRPHVVNTMQTKAKAMPAFSDKRLPECLEAPLLVIARA
jgi:hypothetical protein